jgi:thioredoxin-related protein
MPNKAKKKKLPVRKVSKKSIAPKKPKGKSRVASQTMAMVTVPIDQIQKVETYKGKMSVIPTPLTELQIKHLVAPTPRNVVLKRPGKGGKQFDYIPGWYFRKKLNFTFGWMHDFEILGERIDGDFITVKGKLTIKDKAGKEMISKSDFGGHPVTYMKDKPHKPEHYLDISNEALRSSIGNWS